MYMPIIGLTKMAVTLGRVQGEEYHCCVYYLCHLPATNTLLLQTP